MSPPTLIEKFEVQLAEYEQQNQGRKPWTTERILEIINSVRKAKVSIASKQDRTSMDYYWISKYDTMVVANEVFLIFKRKSPDDPAVRIVPRNNYFGILEDIHKACGHGRRDKMLRAIKSRYYIPRKAIEIFLALCPTCETKKALPKKGTVTKPIVSQDFNIRGQVNLMDFQSCPDGEYKWLLNYHDNATKFVSLRPLITKRAPTLKEKFEVQLAEYEQQNQGRKPWTTERILEIINSVRKAKVSIASKQDRTSMDYYWISKYDTMVVANEVFLIFKRKSPDDPAVRIIPRNNYFGILEDIHKKCGHGGRDKMLRAIKSRYYIPRKAIEIFLALCPTCETKKALPKKDAVTKPSVSQDFNIRGEVNLMDFQSCPDGEYKWLLNYQDNATKFVSLRPLITKRAQEVAMELMKIFMIFGAPYILQSDNGREFTAKIIEELTSMWPECKIVHGSPRRPQAQGSVERPNQDVENMLRTWMNDNNSTNWSIGCHHVQYKKNASFHRIIGRSSYKALFGCNPKAGLNDSGIPISILSNVETEEQLQNLSQKEFSSKINLVDSAIKPVNSENSDQVEYHPNIELEPCSKKLRDESATNTNNLQVQQPDDNRDHSETEELENQQPNFTCAVCPNGCTGALTCTSCENAVHAVCGLSDEEHEGCGSKVLCFLSKYEQGIQSDRNEALKGTKRAAEKMEQGNVDEVHEGDHLAVEIFLMSDDDAQNYYEYDLGETADMIDIKEEPILPIEFEDIVFNGEPMENVTIEAEKDVEDSLDLDIASKRNVFTSLSAYNPN